MEPARSPLPGLNGGEPLGGVSPAQAQSQRMKNPVDMEDELQCVQVPGDVPLVVRLVEHDVVAAHGVEDPLPGRRPTTRL